MKLTLLSAKTIMIGLMALGGMWTISGCGGEEVVSIDETKPTIIVNVFTLGTEGDLTVNVDFADNTALASFTFISEGLGINESVSITGTTHNFTKTYDVSAVANGTYASTVTVTDAVGNTATSSQEVVVDVELVNQYTGEVYAVGDLAWHGWNPVLALPMTKQSEDDGWYEITLFSPGGENVGIKFVGQLDWGPYNWGLVSSANPSEGMVNNDASEKILVSQSGYHLVRFNPTTLQYEISVVDANELPDPTGQMHVMGCGFEGYSLCWGLEDAIPMTQDANNAYMYRIELEFSSSVDLKFNANKAWDEYDCGFMTLATDNPATEVDESKLPPAGNAIFTALNCGGGTADWKYIDRPGTYEIIMDQYLNRASIVSK